MEWYLIVILIILFSAILILVTTFICFRLTFYSKNKPNNNDEINIPDDQFFRNYHDVIINDVEYARSLKHEVFKITSFDGLTLYGKYYEQFKNAPIEIMFHGYRGNSERDLSTGIKRAFKCGRNALIVDQRGSGKSEGHIISFGINERIDCQSWAYFVANKFGKDIPIILTGISMGAATVLMTSSMQLPDNVKGVLADCGYNKASDIIKKVIKEMKLPTNIFYPFVKLAAKIFGKFNLEETSPYIEVQKSKLPIIFIHGSNDSLVPCHMSLKLYEACVSKKRIVTIENAEHGVSYLVDPDKYISELNEFFEYIK